MGSLPAWHTCPARKDKVRRRVPRHFPPRVCCLPHRLNRGCLSIHSATTMRKRSSGSSPSITATSDAYGGCNNSSRMVVDGSRATDSGNGAYALSTSFQSQSSGGWKSNVNFRTLLDGTPRVGILDTILHAHLENCEVSGSKPGFVLCKNNGCTRIGSIFFLVVGEIQMQVKIH